MTIETETLKKHGFISQRKTEIYSKRISDIIFLEYDTDDSFMKMVRFKERSDLKPENRRVDIMIPKKIDTEEKLINLLNAITE